MAKIIIGKEYERAFESICRLVGSGCIPPEIVKSANGREIVTDAYTFRIGNIGEIYAEDIVKVCDIIRSFLEKHGCLDTDKDLSCAG